MAARDDDLVVCEGEWDIARADEFARRAAQGLARGRPALILDLRPATFIDASTIGAIWALSRTAAMRGTGLAVVCGPGFVRRILELAHLADVVPVTGRVDAARSVATCGRMFGRNVPAGPPSMRKEAEWPERGAAP